MKTERREVPQADGGVRVITTVFDDDDVLRKEVRRQLFLQTLVDNPVLYGVFETVSVRHDGKAWRADFETKIARR